MHGFWQGGAAAYGAFLLQDYRERRRACQQRRAETETLSDREQAEDDLRALDAEYAERLAGIRGGLF